MEFFTDFVQIVLFKLVGEMSTDAYWRGASRQLFSQTWLIEVPPNHALADEMSIYVINKFSVCLTVRQVHA